MNFSLNKFVTEKAISDLHSYLFPHYESQYMQKKLKNTSSCLFCCNNKYLHFLLVFYNYHPWISSDVFFYLTTDASNVIIDFHVQHGYR